MNLSAIVEGALAGVAVALLLALTLAAVDYQLTIPPSVQPMLLWGASALTAVASGWMAGRVAEGNGWLNGAMAAITLTVVASAASKTFHLAPHLHIWPALAVSLAGGLIGGVFSALTY
jgi:hydroxylaminobenzene mutase